MVAFHNRIIITFFCFVLLICSVVAGYYSHPIVVVIPAGMVLILLLIQQPQWIIYLLFASIPWSIEYKFSNQLGTDLPDEPLMWLTAFTFLVGFMYRSKLIDFKRIHFLILILVLQYVWIGVTVVFSTDITVSAKYFIAKTWYLLAFVGAPILFLKSEKEVKTTITILLFSMLAVVAIVLVCHSTFNFSFEKVNNALLPFFRNHVNYSALLVFMVPILVAFIQLTRWRIYKVLLVLSLIFVIAALYLSYSRGAWLALVAGVLSYWLIQKRLLVVAFVFAFLLVIVSIFYLKNNNRYLQFAHDYNTTIFHEDFREHLKATYTLKDVSTAERFYRWIAGVRMVKDSWITGFGPTTFYDNYKSYTVPLFKTWVSKNEERSTVHNYFLLLLVEQGILGLLLFLILLGALLWYAQIIYHRTTNPFWKVSAAAIVVILVMQGVVNFLSDLVETDKVGSIFYFCIAILVIADRATKKEITPA